MLKTPEILLRTPSWMLKMPVWMLKTPERLLRTPEPVLRTPGWVLKTPEILLKTPDLLLRTPGQMLRTPGDEMGRGRFSPKSGTKAPHLRGLVRGGAEVGIMEFWQATAQRWWRSRTLESRYAVFDPFPIVPITTIGSSFRTKTKLIFDTRVHLFPNYSQMMLWCVATLFPVFQSQGTWVGREIERLPGQDRNRTFGNTGRTFGNHMVTLKTFAQTLKTFAAKCQGGHRIVV